MASFKKSKNFGNFRVNISKSGLGFSVGTKGFRAGIDSKGNAYTSVGANGVYQRTNLSAGSNTKSAEQPSEASTPPSESDVKSATIGLAIGLVDSSIAVGGFTDHFFGMFTTLKVIAIILYAISALLLLYFINCRKTIFGECTKSKKTVWILRAFALAFFAAGFWKFAFFLLAPPFLILSFADNS